MTGEIQAQCWGGGLPSPGAEDEPLEPVPSLPDPAGLVAGVLPVPDASPGASAPGTPPLEPPLDGTSDVPSSGFAGGSAGATAPPVAWVIARSGSAAGAL